MCPCRRAALNAAERTVMSVLSVEGASPAIADGPETLRCLYCLSPRYCVAREPEELDKFIHHLLMSQRRFIRSGLLFLLYEMIEPLLDREHMQFFATDALQERRSRVCACGLRLALASAPCPRRAGALRQRVWLWPGWFLLWIFSAFGRPRWYSTRTRRVTGCGNL